MISRRDISLIIISAASISAVPGVFLGCPAKAQGKGKSGDSGSEGKAKGGNSSSEGKERSKEKSAQGKGGAQGSGKPEDRSKGIEGSDTTLPSSRGATLSFRHPDGIVEQIVGNIYMIFDRQGRRIVQRKATTEDRSRLRRLAR